jgi:hypothetical protein
MRRHSRSSPGQARDPLDDADLSSGSAEMIPACSLGCERGGEFVSIEPGGEVKTKRPARCVASQALVSLEICARGIVSSAWAWPKTNAAPKDRPFLIETEIDERIRLRRLR